MVCTASKSPSLPPSSPASLGPSPSHPPSLSRRREQSLQTLTTMTLRALHSPVQMKDSSMASPPPEDRALPSPPTLFLKTLAQHSVLTLSQKTQAPSSALTLSKPQSRAPVRLPTRPQPSLIRALLSARLSTSSALRLKLLSRLPSPARPPPPPPPQQPWQPL